VELCAPDLSGLDLSNLILDNADFQGANLSNVNFRGTKLRDADFSRANLAGADLSYCDISGSDLREADLTNAQTYPCGHNRRTKFWDSKIDRNSELATMSKDIVKARLKRSTDIDEFDLHQAQKATESFLDFKTKRLEKKVAEERRGWKQIPGDQIIKAKLRVLRYSKNIALDSERRRRDLRFLTKQGVDLSFASKLTNEIG